LTWRLGGSRLHAQRRAAGFAAVHVHRFVTVADDPLKPTIDRIGKVRKRKSRFPAHLVRCGIGHGRRFSSGDSSQSPTMMRSPHVSHQTVCSDIPILRRARIGGGGYGVVYLLGTANFPMVLAAATRRF
jgi:hypothetical protein